MTLIIGYADQIAKKSYVIGDSLVTCGGLVVTEKEDKVFKKGGLIIGGAGNAQYTQLVQNIVYETSKNMNNFNFIDFIHQNFVPALREIKEEYGLKRKNIGDLVIAYNGEVCSIDPDFYVHVPKSNYVCIGAGAELAYGAIDSHMYLCGIKTMSVGITDFLHNIMRSVEQRCIYVRSPFTLLES